MSDTLNYSATFVQQSGVVTPGHAVEWLADGVIADAGPAGSGGFTGILPVINGGNGTATPALTAGTNVTLSGTWPNYTINATGGGGGGGGNVSSVGTPAANQIAQWTTANTIQGISVLPVSAGGNGTASPALTAGSNVTITGSWPNYTIASTGSGGGGGNVSNVGTPTNGQLAQWTGATTVQGINAGTGVATALGVNVGSAGGIIVGGGALGMPSSGLANNLTGTAPGLTAGTATGANGLNSLTTTVVVNSAVAPSAGQVLTAINNAAASWQAPSGAFLPLTGGTLAGPGNLVVGGSLSANGAGQFNATLGVTGLVAFAYPTVNDFLIERTGGFRTLQWSTSSSFTYTESSGNTSIVYGGTVTFSVDPSGNMAINGANASKPSGSASWIITSDERVKRHIEDYTTGLKEIIALRPIVFEYNGKYGTPDDGVRQIGLSAQETQPHMPEMVVKMPGQEDLLGIDTGPLSLAMINALRELSERVEALERKVAAYES